MQSPAIGEEQAAPATPEIMSSQSNEKHARMFASDATAALLSSSAYTMFFYPIHRVKVLLQTQDAHPDVTSGAIKRYSFHSSFPRIIREQGIVGMWRGSMPYMMRHVPSTTLSFALKDSIQRHMPDFDPQQQQAAFMASRLAAGGLAGIMALAVVYPLDFATIRMAANFNTTDPGLLHTLEHTHRAGGWRSLYRGFGVSAAAIGGYKALYFGLYDIAKAMLLDSDGDDGTDVQQQQQGPGLAATSHSAAPAPSLSAAVAAAASAEPPGLQDAGSCGAMGATTLSSRSIHSINSTIASLANGMLGLGWSGNTVWSLFQSWCVASGVVYLATTVTYPLDVIRKRLVVDTALPVRQYTGFWDCVKQTAKKEGLRGFYRFYMYDMVLRFGGGIMLVLYDEVKQVQARHRRRGPAPAPPPPLEQQQQQQ